LSCVEASLTPDDPDNLPVRIFDTMPLFRVIYTSRTHFRLMETAGGDPVAWLVQMPTVPGDPNSVLIAVRDIVSLLDDVPVHRGIELSVLTEGSDIDDAIARAFSNADTLLTVLSASSRAPAEPLRPFVGFDVSPDLVERTLVQWFPDLDYPIGKTPVPQAAFDALLQRLPTATEKAGSRLMASAGLAGH
jgi:hypothetical protein